MIKMFAERNSMSAGLLRLIFMALILVFTANMASASENTPPPPTVTDSFKTDDKSKLRQILKQINNFSAEFDQKITDGNGELIQQASGRIVVAKPQKLRWEIISPEPSLLIADSQTIFNVDPFVEQVTLIDQADMTNSNPLMLLISDEQTQWDNVTVLKQDNSFIITPNQPDSSIIQLILRFDSSSNLIGLSSVDRQEQNSTLVFENLVTNKPITANLFTFQIPENYVVDDQRAN